MSLNALAAWFTVNWPTLLVVLSIILMLFVLSACADPKGLSKLIPPNEFKSFSYDRGGNVTSAHIKAENAKFDKDGNLEIGTVDINADYGPVVNFKMHIEGLKVKNTNEGKDESKPPILKE